MKGHGPEMTTIDPATGEVGTREMPVYTDAKCKEAWEPVAAGIMARVKKRRLENSMMLGLLCDYAPTKESALGIQAVFPGVPWASVAHQFPKDFFGIPVKYKANVFAQYYCSDPSERRFYGWNNPNLECHFPRLIRDYFPLTTFRLAEEMSFLRNYRGVVRMGADFWPVLKNKRGQGVYSLPSRFPKSFWNNLNVEVTLLAQGQNGPVATVRLEAIREGLQECEARIVVEHALSDKNLHAKLGDALPGRLQNLLDDRSREVRNGTSSFIASGHYGQWALAPENWWQRPGVVGHHYYIGSNWQQRSADLFDAAAEVTAKLDAN